MIEDRELEFSPLSGPVTQDGITADVKIYRFAEPGDRWQLEVVDHEGGWTVWGDPFPTDQDAYRAFQETLSAEDIRTFLDDKPSDEVLH